MCLEYVDGRGELRRGPLEVMWPVPFESAGPVRRFPSFRGQRNFTGWYWAATGAVHVGYESWLERDHLMRLDFDPQVTAMVSQPFRLSWRVEGRRRRVEHTPDYFVRRRDGTAVVIDVRPDERVEPQDAVKFAVTREACGRVGWNYQRVGVMDPVLVANVRWLAGYRHPRVMRDPVAVALRTVFQRGQGLLEGVRVVGDPIAVLPVLFHLLWRRDLTADLESALLSAATLVGPGPVLSSGEVDRDVFASSRAVGG
ncbi:TnsA-like heteromeric transposase endonuclease subunit [Streptomyces sp. URMC 127]|uniref:TnsA-like heteromeric transposase endonuclease subunit n=1 Tax=Streptomyces sp. URMC 127 TaxID=3423402 RepID=UPI003F1A2E56